MPTDEELREMSCRGDGDLEILRGLGACPAISFMEGPVATYVQRYLGGLGLSARSDGYGNLVIHHSGRSQERESQPPIAFVAHMDHPGFEALVVCLPNGFTIRQRSTWPPVCLLSLWERIEVRVRPGFAGRTSSYQHCNAIYETLD